MRSKLESAQAEQFKKASPDICELSWLHSALTFALPSASHLHFSSSSGPGPTLLPQQELSQIFDEEVLVFCHNAGPAVYDVVLGSDAAPTTPPVKTMILTQAGLVACIFSVIQFLREENFQRRPTPTEVLGRLRTVPSLRSTELLGALRQIAEYRRSEVSETDPHSTSLAPRKDFVFHMLRIATRIVDLSSLSEIYLPVDTH